MKQKISFNSNIYFETLRQLRVTGIISAIVMAGLIILRIADIFTYASDDYFYKYRLILMNLLHKYLTS